MVTSFHIDQPTYEFAILISLFIQHNEACKLTCVILILFSL